MSVRLLLLSCLLACALIPLRAAEDEASDPDTALPDSFILTWPQDPSQGIVALWLERGLAPPGELSGVLPPTIPHLADIVIDGKPEDWGQQGLRLDFLARPDGSRPAAEDLSAAARLGWDEQGLLLLVEVQDAEAIEAETELALWSADGLELFVATDASRRNRIQLALSPGRDQAFAGQIRTQFFDRRPPRHQDDPLRVEAAGGAIDGGWRIELRLPWEQLPVKARNGHRFALQLYVNDRDQHHVDRERDIVCWFPSTDTHGNPGSMHEVILGTAPSPPERGRIIIRNIDEAAGHLELELQGPRELAGHDLTLSSGTAEIGSLRLTAQKTHASALHTVAIASLPSPEILASDADGQFAALSVPLWLLTRPPAARQVQLLDAKREPLHEVASTVERLGRSEWYVHRVKFTKLTAGTVHHLVVDDGRLAFATVPATLSQAQRLAVGGDLRLNDRALALLGQAASWDPLALVLGGNAVANGDSPAAWLQLLRSWHRIGRRSNGEAIPLLLAAGENEVRGEPQDSKHPSPLKTLFGAAAADGRGHWGVIDLSDWASLYLLDSSKAQVIAGPQTRWLERSLKRRGTGRHQIVVYHAPAWPGRQALDVGDDMPQDPRGGRLQRRHWAPLFEQHGVALVLEHAEHCLKRSHPLRGDDQHPEGVVYAGGGALGGARTTAGLEGRPWLNTLAASAHIQRLTLLPEQFLLESLDPQGELLDRWPEGNADDL